MEPGCVAAPGQARPMRRAQGSWWTRARAAPDMRTSVVTPRLPHPPRVRWLRPETGKQCCKSMSHVPVCGSGDSRDSGGGHGHSGRACLEFQKNLQVRFLGIESGIT